MKQPKWIMLLTATLVIGSASIVFAGITGSDHDFSSATWSSGQICKPCHTPHHAMSVADGPLWNHTETTATYQTYPGGGTMNATPGNPSGVSKLCLSCHDGTVAVDAMAGGPGSGIPAGRIGGNGLIGTDLRQTHPISFDYTAALATADGELANPTTASSGVTASGTIATDMLFGTSNNKFECASCHDVHNAYNQSYLLLKSNAGSALCLTCHLK